VLAFISFIFTAPYLIMKLLGTVTNTAQEEGLFAHIERLVYLISALCTDPAQPDKAGQLDR